MYVVTFVGVTTGVVTLSVYVYGSATHSCLYVVTFVGVTTVRGTYRVTVWVVYDTPPDPASAAATVPPHPPTVAGAEPPHPPKSAATGAAPHPPAITGAAQPLPRPPNNFPPNASADCGVNHAVTPRTAANSTRRFIVSSPDWGLRTGLVSPTNGGEAEGSEAAAGRANMLPTLPRIPIRMRGIGISLTGDN